VSTSQVTKNIFRGDRYDKLLSNLGPKIGENPQFSMKIILKEIEGILRA
jgi:hypothetical protein